MQTMTTRFPLPAVEFNFAGFTFPRYVALLPRGTVAQRLARYVDPVTGPYYHAPRPLGPHAGKGFYLNDSTSPDFRWEWCDGVPGANIGHTGWFLDDFYEEKVRGLVVRLPHGKGFLAGWSMGEGMASAIGYTIYESAVDAAYNADRDARSVAEENCEDYAHRNPEEAAA